jgi:O-antigen ligase
MATNWDPEPLHSDTTDGSNSRIPFGLVLLIGLVAFSPLIEGGATQAAVMVIRLGVLGCLGWTWGMACREGKVTMPSLSVAPAVWAFLGLALVSTLCSPYPHQSVQWLIVLFTYAALLYLLVSSFTAWEHVRRISVAVALLGTAEAVLGIGQYLWGDALRPSGTFFNPNFFAGYLVAVATSVMGLISMHRVRRSPGLWGGGVCLLSLLVGAVLMSGSRGAMLALAVGAAVVLVLRYQTRGVVAVGVLILGVLLVPNPLMERLRAEHRANALSYARVQMWAGAVQEMREHPMGVGLGLYQYVYPLHPAGIEGQITRYGRMAQNAHNEYLQIGVELGIPGLLIFLWGILLIGQDAVTFMRRRLRRLHRGVVVGACGAVAALLVHASVDANLHEPALAILLTCFAAMLLSARQWAGVEGASPAAWSLALTERRLAVGAVGVGVVGAVVMGVVGMGVAWSAHEAGNQAAARQDYVRAIQAYERAIAMDPAKALYHSSLGAVHYQTFIRTGRPSEAEVSIAELKNAMALNPLDGRLPALLGNVYVSMVRMMDSGRGPAEKGQGPSEERTAWLQAASSAYEEALKREPYSPFYRLELARLRALEHDHGEAERILRELLALEPNFLPGRALLMKVLMEQGRDRAAQDEYRDIVARLQRFAHWTKDPLEQRYLDIDTASLTGDHSHEVARL